MAVQKLSEEQDVKYSDETWSAPGDHPGLLGVYQDAYEPNGISYDSWRYQVENSYLDNELFLALYTEGGDLAHDLEETQAAYEGKYAHVRYFSIPNTALSDDDEAPL